MILNPLYGDGCHRSTRAIFKSELLMTGVILPGAGYCNFTAMGSGFCGTGNSKKTSNEKLYCLNRPACTIDLLQQ